MIAWLFKRPERQPQPARLKETLEGITLKDLKRSKQRAIIAERRDAVTDALLRGLAFGITSPIAPRDTVVAGIRPTNGERT